ncbi:hypothetical protein ACFL20_06395 [Spirochaetota bacterium]
MLYLIGIDHLIQYENDIVPGDTFLEFKAFLEETAVNHNISLMAEEFSEESLFDVYNSPEGTVKSVALKLGIEHMYCDPEEGDRKKLGIPYFAEIERKVKNKYNIRDKFIIDNSLRKKVYSETVKLSKTYWPIREIFWYEKILHMLNENILFICGHEHINSFGSLLSEKGYTTKIIDPFWKKSLFSDYGKLRLK